jgi:CubicO group peptidase (beta-lactamase class C family)
VLCGAFGIYQYVYPLSFYVIFLLFCFFLNTYLLYYTTNTTQELLIPLLNNGKCPKTGSQILKPSSVEELFTNQIPEFPNFARPGLVPVKFSFANPVEALYPQPLDQAQGWSLAGFHHVHGTATGRAAGTNFWAGISNQFWWVDRQKGVAGFVVSQILPFGGEYNLHKRGNNQECVNADYYYADMDVLTVSAEIEMALYSEIAKSSRTSNI